MQPSPWMPHYACTSCLCLSVNPSVSAVPTVNSNTEHRTTIKVLGQVTARGSNWRAILRSEDQSWRSLKVETLKLFSAYLHVKPRRWWQHSVMHVSTSNNCGAKMRRHSSGRIQAWRSRWTPCVHSTMTDHRAGRTQDAIRPTAVDACVADDVASQTTGRQQYSTAEFYIAVNGPNI